MKFKIAISVEDSPKPYHIHLAIPDNGKFTIHVYAFKRDHDAMEMFHRYFNEYYKHPDTILEFHKETQELFEKNLELPFGI